MIKVDRSKARCHCQIQLKPKFIIGDIFLYLLPVKTLQHISYTLLQVKTSHALCVTEVMKTPLFSQTIYHSQLAKYVFYVLIMYSCHLNNEYLLKNINSVI